MLTDFTPGPIHEPLTQRTWSRATVVDRLSVRSAYYGDRGMGDGDRVFIHFGNVPEFFVDLLAIWHLGACAVPVDSRLTAFEVENLARAARPRYSIWSGTPHEDLAARLAGLGIESLLSAEADAAGTGRERISARGSARSHDREALILFTSGTTGQPKGVLHTHRSLRARWASLNEHLGLASFRRTLCLLPTHFGHGLICNCLFPWLAGQELFILPPFKPDLLMQLGSLLDEHEITFMSSVPSMWRFVLKTARPPRRGRIERVICGSAPLSARLWMNIREWAGTQDVVNAYGITETGSWVAGTTVEGVELEDGLIGLPWGADRSEER